METLPFRPPQFSDDAAWLPAWLQSTQPATLTSPNEPYQNMGTLKGHSNPVRDPNLLSSIGCRYNSCHLYLSGEDISPVTVSPSSEKVLHLNLHLSTDGTSSIHSTPLLNISQDKLNSSKKTPMQSVEAQCSPRDISKSKMHHNSSAIIPFISPSNENCSGNLSKQTPSKSWNSRQDIMERFNSKDTEFDDINSAVELSVAASEALVIHEVVKSGSFSEALSSAAILEVALRVKQARLDRLNDSFCCSMDEGNTTDFLSDLSDSDMEDAYQDVGLSLSSLDNMLFKDPSVSRVQDTPMSEIHRGLEREVQSEWHGDQEIYVNNGVIQEPLQSNLNSSESKDVRTEVLDSEKQEKPMSQGFGSRGFCLQATDLGIDTGATLPLSLSPIDSEKQEKVHENPTWDLIFGTVNQSQPANLDDLQITQRGNYDVGSVDRVPHELEVKSSPQALDSGKGNEGTPPKMWHSYSIDMDKANGKSSCSFQSRWFGGWTGKEGDACAGAKLNGTKTIPKLLVGETSYLSESADVAPDENSFVHNHHRCAKGSESIMPMEDFCGTASGGAVIGHDVVKDSTLSSIDPLCSVVPCSISAEIDSHSLGTNNNDNLRVLDAVKSLTTGFAIPLENVEKTSGQCDEYVSPEEHDEPVVKAIGPSPIIRRQLTSLKAYSMGLPRNSTSSLNRNFDCGLANRKQCDASSGGQGVSYTSFPKGKDVMKPPPIVSISNCITARSNQEHHQVRKVSVEQHISCTHTSDEQVSTKQPAFRPVLSCATAANNEENRETSGLGNAFGRPIQEGFERNATDGGQLQVDLHDKPKSPLVLCHNKRRRFKAPKLPATDTSMENQVEERHPGSDIVYHKSAENRQAQDKKFPNSDVPAKKRVRFSEVDVKFHPKKKHKMTLPSSKFRSSCRVRDRPENSEQEQTTTSQEVKERLTNCRVEGRKKPVFQGLDFLLTGFTGKKEKDIEWLLKKHGGVVLSDIPFPLAHPRRRGSSTFDAQRLPVVLCTKKLRTTKFLYGCAVNAFLLRVGWAYDSIKAGSVLPPDKYVILPNQRSKKLNQIGKEIHQNDDHIFDKVGIMLYGRHSFCSKLVDVIKHGQGQVFKSLQWLLRSLGSNKISVAAIVVEDENRAPRHLKKCASEQKIPVVPASWIINSLFEGKLLPFRETCHSSHLPPLKVPQVSTSMEWTQEI